MFGKTPGAGLPQLIPELSLALYTLLDEYSIVTTLLGQLYIAIYSYNIAIYSYIIAILVFARFSYIF